MEGLTESGEKAAGAWHGVVCPATWQAAAAASRSGGAMRLAATSGCCGCFQVSPMVLRWAGGQEKQLSLLQMVSFQMSRMVLRWAGGEEKQLSLLHTVSTQSDPDDSCMRRRCETENNGRIAARRAWEQEGQAWNTAVV